MSYNFDEYPDLDRSDFVRHNPAFLKSIFGSSDLLPFWVADTDFAVMPELKEALIERAAKARFAYETKSPAVKKALTNWYAENYDIKIHPKRLLFTTSVNSSIAFIIDQFTNEGDGVIIQPPVYQAFAGIIQGLNRTIINNPLQLIDNHYEIDFEDLEQKARQSSSKIFLLCSPHNPVGRVWTTQELTKIAEICAEHNLLLITDEIHGDVVYSPNKYIGMLSVYEPYGNNIIMVSSGGKTFGIPSLIDSFISTPNIEYHKALQHHLEVFHLDKSNAFSNTAMQAVYEYGRPWLDQMISYLKGNIDYIANYTEAELPLVNLPKPEGSYQIWLDFRKLGLNNEELAKFLVDKAGLALNQGHTYGHGGDGFARMNIASPRAIIEKAMNQLKTALDPT